MTDQLCVCCVSTDVAEHQISNTISFAKVHFQGVWYCQCLAGLQKGRRTFQALLSVVRQDINSSWHCLC